MSLSIADVNSLTFQHYSHIQTNSEEFKRVWSVLYSFYTFQDFGRSQHSYICNWTQRFHCPVCLVIKIKTECPGNENVHKQNKAAYQFFNKLLLNAKITWKTWSCLWQEETCHNLSHSFIKVYCQDQAEVHLSRGAGKGSSSQTPAHRRRLSALCPADNQPGTEKPLRSAGGGHIAILNLSDMSSPPERTSLPSSLEVSAPILTAVLQWLHWFCHSLKNNFL